MANKQNRVNYTGVSKKQRVASRIAVLCWLVVLILCIVMAVVNAEPEADAAVPPAPVCTHDLTPTVIVEEVVEVVEEVTVTYDVYAPWSVSDRHATMLAKLAWGEARGCSTMEQAAVMWCALNRVDSEDPQFPDYLEDVITQENQFYYSESFPVKQELFLLALDVLARWNSEHYLMGESGRVLPQEYLWFGGDGEHNWFRTTLYLNGSNWDWSLPNPYEGGLG